ncbi:glycoside hydrolase family 3 C-terminal domain-containing protein [Arthrobacter sp. Soil782]|uniref:glycoside hydrolase family 3 C-terminal domain-containing protein n=1 Tax=Arthrobacter sp. Soil782 TaxID=1736410 RepID=UPI0009E9350C|nr:glycoside hydrolase family 3 C-terminal domain-containing protein [Arthrobacter sp. Soil782]
MTETRLAVRTAQGILATLSRAEKIALLHQHSPALPDAGLAYFHTGAEAAHGVAWLGDATVFPQTVGLAASWDEDLLRRVGRAVGVEMRAKKAADPTVSLNVWAPVVNPLRHPLWGRNEEGFSEDSGLTASLATAYCEGLKGDSAEQWLTVPTLKHFLGYNNERDRNVTSSQLPPRVLHEYELPAYRLPIESGAAGAVMLSYNLVNGRPAHVSDLVAEHLRTWRNGDSLAVVTDAGAPSSLFTAEKYFDDGASAYAAALRAGVDSFTDDGDDSAPSIAYLEEALERGLISVADIDAAVLRLLTLRERTGEFESDGGVYGSIPADELLTPEHAALAREAARKSVVVLRNAASSVGISADAGPILPLRDEPGAIAVIGSLGAHVLSDWYSGTLVHPVSIAAGIEERYGSVIAEEGLDLVALRSTRTNRYVGVPDGSAALTALAGSPGSAESLVLKDWGNGEYTLRSSVNGRFVSGESGYLRATSERVGGWVVQETFALHRSVEGSVALRHIASGKWVRVEEGTGSAVLVTGSEQDADRFALRTIRSGAEAARKAAASADVAVVVVGNDPHLGGRETIDRTTLDLPQSEQELIRVVREANPRTVLVIVSSYPYALGELAGVPSIVWSSHGGQELGRGVADVLSGDHEPSGRLPQTWWARDADLADILDYDIIGSRSTYSYSTAEPLYPLGHGLGYAAVEYESASYGDGALAVSVRNAGGRDVHELVQVYGTSDLPGYPRRRLVAHARVSLKPGERTVVSIPVAEEKLAVFSPAAGRMLVEPGTYDLLIGRSAVDLPLAVALVVSGSGSPARRRGSWIRAELFDESVNALLVPETPLQGTAVTVADPALLRALLTYRGWGGAAPASVSVRVARSAGGLLRIVVPGPADTWREWGAAFVAAGYAGDVEIPLAGGSDAMPAVVRLVIEGGVTVSELLVPEP